MSLGTPCPQQHLLPPTRTVLLAPRCSTSAVAEAACSRAQRHCRAAHHRDAGELGGGSSNLFDIEQQQQLQHLHSRQEWCEENAEPRRERGRRARPGSEPRGSGRWAELGAAAGHRRQLPSGFCKAKSKHTTPRARFAAQPVLGLGRG